MPKISVIIPCYNHGKFIQEAIDSVKEQSFKDWEIIVINNCSDDPYTLKIFKLLEEQKIKVLHSEKRGPSAARNMGIKNSSGDYILPLDADDKIGPEYLELGSKFLDSNPETGIVYCKANFFDHKSGEWDLGLFDIKTMLQNNQIFSCALYRKCDWEKVGGYNESMPYKEDYDFWLSILELGRTVYRIDKTLFFYRKHKVKHNSLSKRTKRYELPMIEAQLVLNHQKIYSNNIDVLANIILEAKRKIVYLHENTFRYKFKKMLYKIVNIVRSKELPDK